MGGRGPGHKGRVEARKGEGRAGHERGEGGRPQPGGDRADKGPDSGAWARGPPAWPAAAHSGKAGAACGDKRAPLARPVLGLQWQVCEQRVRPLTLEFFSMLAFILGMGPLPNVVLTTSSGELTEVGWGGWEGTGGRSRGLRASGTGSAQRCAPRRPFPQTLPPPPPAGSGCPWHGHSRRLPPPGTPFSRHFKTAGAVAWRRRRRPPPC
jgi:hypothetical protein